MKLISPSYTILQPEDWRIWGVKKHIERVGRTCYKSEDKITDDSYDLFVQNMINSKHYSMLEHGTIYLKIENNSTNWIVYINHYVSNKYSVVNYHDGFAYITTNLRVLVENDWINDQKHMCEPTEHHAKRMTVKFVCNRQVSHEFVRHRVFSFAQESTRYCNYTKDKFGNELTFILPCWLRAKYTNKELCIEEDNTWDANTFYRLPNQPIEISNSIGALQGLECHYFELIKLGWKPQQAATILPNSLKTELVMTGYMDDWKHFFDLRAIGTTGAPHPQAKELAIGLYEFVKSFNAI